MTANNWGAAHDLALVLSKTGKQRRAEWLLERNLEYIQAKSRLGEVGYGSADVQIFALQGKKKKALKAPSASD